MSTRVERIQQRWERITPRERMLIVVSGVVAVVIVLLMISFSVGDRLAELEENTTSKREALAALRDHQLNASQDTGAPNVTIPEEAIKLRGYINRVATRVGVKIPSYDTKPKAKRGEFVEVATGIKLQDLTVQQLQGLLSGIEKDPKVVVQTLQIRRSFRNKETMNVELVVATYEQAKKEKKENDDDGG